MANKVEKEKVEKDPAATILKGYLVLTEEAREGIHFWSFRDEDADRSNTGGIRELAKGDVLIVFNDAARQQQIWSGVVDLDYATGAYTISFAVPQAQTLEGVGLVHGLPRGDIDIKKWVRMFTAGRPAFVIPAANLRKA